MWVPLLSIKAGSAAVGARNGYNGSRSLVMILAGRGDSSARELKE